MAGNNRSLMVKGYIMTLLGGLLWSVGGACGQVIFRDCGVISDWLVPIRLFIGGLITLSAAAIAGDKPMATCRIRSLALSAGVLPAGLPPFASTAIIHLSVR